MAATVKRKPAYCSWDGPRHMQQGIVYVFCEKCGGAVGIGQRKVCRKRRPARPRRRQIVLYEVRD